MHWVLNLFIKRCEYFEFLHETAFEIFRKSPSNTRRRLFFGKSFRKAILMYYERQLFFFLSRVAKKWTVSLFIQLKSLIFSQCNKTEPDFVVYKTSGYISKRFHKYWKHWTFLCENSSTYIYTEKEFDVGVTKNMSPVHWKKHQLDNLFKIFVIRSFADKTSFLFSMKCMHTTDILLNIRVSNWGFS